MTTPTPCLSEHVAAIRRFSRFYTREIGVLHEGLLGGPLSLTESRIVYDLAQSGPWTATRLGTELRLDAGYLSRLLRGLEAQGLIERRPSETDGRQTLLSLTPEGQQMFASIDARSRDEVGVMLARLPWPDRQRLVDALTTAERLLGKPPTTPPPYRLRSPQPGDMGWVVHRHAALYTQEYGWDSSFEALVAEIAAQFIKNFDPTAERCWIAEREGTVVGSAFLVRQSETTGKLRLVYVEPSARGLGIGRRMVEECINQARLFGYQRLTLSTHSILTAARNIYRRAGFQLMESERHHSFGHDLVGETWELMLGMLA